MIASGPSQLALAVAQANQEKAYSDNYLAKAGHLALASVVDFGTSVYNSADLGWVHGGDWFDDLETSQVLDGMGAAGTADFYEDNKDLVNGVSFIGGIFVPGMAAVKGSRMLRAGLKGSHFLSPMAQRSNLRTISRMVREGKKGTEQYRKMKFKTMRNAVAQGVVDNAAAEVAILGTLNAHPLMEDYMEDVPANFMMSLAFGSAISGVIDMASSASAIKTVAGHTLARQHAPVLAATPITAPTVGAGTDFKMMQQTKKDLQGIIESAENNPDFNFGETAAFARSMLLNTEEAMRRGAASIAEATGLKADSAEFMQHVEKVMAKPESFGVDKISFYAVEKAKPKQGMLGKLTGLIKKVDPVNEGDAPTFRAAGIYSPQFDMYLDEDTAARLASAVDAGQTPETIAAMAKQAKTSRLWETPTDIAQNYTNAAAHEVDADYLMKLKLYDDIKLDDLGKAKIHVNDLASLQGASARIAKERTALSKYADDISAKQEELTAATKTADINKLEKDIERLTKIHDNKKAALDNLKIEVVDAYGSAKAFKGTGVGADHVGRVKATVDSLPNIIDDVSSDLARVLDSWFNGEHGMDEAIRSSVAKAARSGEFDSSAIEELFRSNHGKVVRKALKANADKDGYIYLPMSPTRAKGIGAEIDTFALSGEAGAKLTRVSVRQVLGVMRADDGTSQLLAINTTADSVRSNLKGYQLDEAGGIRVGNQAVASAELEAYTRSTTEAWVMQQSRATLDEGLGVEELARRSNMDLDSVYKVLGMPNPDALAEAGGTVLRYTQANQISEYMKPATRMLRASDDGNLTSHYEFTKMVEANADRKLLEDWAMDVTLDLMSTSKSDLVNNLLKRYGADTEMGASDFRKQMALLKRSLGLVNDELAGQRLIQSADMYARRMQDAGKLINHFGDKFTAAFNETADNLIAPMNESLSKIARNDAQVVTLNLALQVHRSIGSGRIKFVDGMFYNKLPGEKQWKEVLWEGKVFQVPESMMEVRNFLVNAASVGEELQKSRVTRAKLTGGRPPSNKGFWLPNFDLRSKHVAFVEVNGTDNYIITGSTVEKLREAEQAVREVNKHADLRIITPQERDTYQYLLGQAQDGMLSGVDSMLRA